MTGRTDARPEDPLFITAGPKRANKTQESITSILYLIAKKTKGGEASPAPLRHTFAIQFLRNGGDVFTLQRLWTCNIGDDWSITWPSFHFQTALRHTDRPALRIGGIYDAQ